MTKPIATKKGTPLFEATFSLIDKILVNFHDEKEDAPRQIRITEKNKLLFDRSVALVKDSATTITVEDIHLFPGALLDADISKFILALDDLGIKNGRQFSNANVYTQCTKNIRALAKELRADKAVAKAAKIPSKPKADLKTRRDVI